MHGLKAAGWRFRKAEAMRKHTFILALLIVLGLSSGGTSASNSNIPSGPVTMGILSCFTGTLASLGQAMLQGAQVAHEEVNDARGILGKKLNLAHADTQCDEADSVPAVHQLLASQNLVGIIGPETQEINAVAPILTASKIPDEFQGGSTLFDHNNNPWLWRNSPSDSQLGVAMAPYAQKQGYKNAALLFSSDIAAQTFAHPITATWQKMGNQIVANVVVAPDQTDYRTQVQQVINSHPDVIFTQTDPATAAVLLQNFKQLDNLAIPFVGTDVTGADDFLKAITYPVAHAHLTSVYETSVIAKPPHDFTRVYTSLFGSANPPLPNANYAYDAVISLALAIEKANSIDGTAINKQMDQVTNPPGTMCYTYASCLALINT